MGKIWSSDDEIIKMLFNKLEKKNSKKGKETFDTLFLSVLIYIIFCLTQHPCMEYINILKY